MTSADGLLLVPFLIALLCWIRGVWQRDRGDIALSGVVVAISSGIYAIFYHATLLEGVPGISLLIGGATALVITILKSVRPRWDKMAVVLVLAPVLLGLALLAGERQWTQSSNSLFVIAPYRVGSSWAFDDPSAGLKGEPFVSGIPAMIDKLVAEAGIPATERSFRLIFSSRAFPNYQAKVVRGRTEAGGHWYYCKRLDKEGWLCPALFKYFRRAPKEIYIKTEPE